jgi:NAD+ diphosphatase
MIQEIEPKKLWNTYEKREPGAASRVVCVWKEQYLILHEEGGDRYPLLRELPGILPEELQYLFALREDEERTDYFLYICGEQPEFSFPTPYSWETTYYINHAMKPRAEAFAGMTAHHLHTWYKANRFCGCCGVPMVHGDRERMMRCPECGNMVFPKIAPAVLAAVFHDGKLLLTKYAHGDGNYALVAGFVEIGETAEQCVEREVFEETGLRVKNIRYYDSQPWGFAGNLMLAYTAELDGDDATIRRDASELAAAEFVAPENLTDISDYNSLTWEMIRRFRKGELSSENMNKI